MKMSWEIETHWMKIISISMNPKVLNHNIRVKNVVVTSHSCDFRRRKVRLVMDRWDLYTK